MAHVRRGDLVVVTKGREKGKSGKVKRLLPKGRLEVEKVMMVKRHVKPNQKNQQGGIIEMEAGISMANVALWCEKCSSGVRSKFVLDEAGLKSRACVKCDTVFPS
jgi:large subunit ribosomal protein L24